MVNIIMKEKKYTIVYVFGPMFCYKKYREDQLLSIEKGEWVKIGETEYNGEIEEKSIMQRAMYRINQESRTGIPVISTIYDVFIYPYKKNTDNIVRGRLCSEMFEIDNSKQINKEQTNGDYEVKAGNEFVYTVSRSKILYAVQSIDHEKIADAVEERDNEQILLMAEICHFNNKILDNNQDETGDTEQGQRKSRLDLDSILEKDAEVVLTKNSGEIVVDENGEAIKATYIGGNKFECKGEFSRSSPLALKYLNLYAGTNLSTVNGNEYWRFEGQKLTSLRRDS